MRRAPSPGQGAGETWCGEGVGSSVLQPHSGKDMWAPSRGEADLWAPPVLGAHLPLHPRPLGPGGVPCGSPFTPPRALPATPAAPPRSFPLTSLPAPTPVLSLFLDRTSERTRRNLTTKLWFFAFLQEFSFHPEPFPLSLPFTGTHSPSCRIPGPRLHSPGEGPRGGWELRPVPSQVQASFPPGQPAGPGQPPPSRLLHPSVPWVTHP